MSRPSLVLFTFVASAIATACSGAESSVDTTTESSTHQELKRTKDGRPSGNGAVCSWDDVVISPSMGTVSSDPNTPTSDSSPSAPGDVVGLPAGLPGPYKIGERFKSLDGCNDCTCTKQGIMCTVRACSSPPHPGGPPQPPVPGCTEEAKQCPDGSFVGRTGPNCAFAECPDTPQPPPPNACTMDAKRCPDGSYVSRSGPACEFAPCPR